MPALRNATTTNTVSASATGLTGLDNAGLAFSWSAWLRIRPNDMPIGQGQAAIWVHADNGGGQSKNGISIFVNGTGGVRFRPQTASTNLVQSPAGVVTTEWQHIGIRKDSTAVTFFRNGRAVASVANTVTPTVSGTRLTELGGPTVSGVMSLRGVDVWDVRVFPLLALSNGEMGMLADPRSSVRGCKQRLLYQHNWRVAGSGAQTLLDESGNGNSLTTSATTEHASVIDEPDWHLVLFGRRVFGRAPGGVLYTQSLSASLTPAAALERETRRTVAASATPSATVVKNTRRTLSASATPAATVTKRTARSLSASLTATATVAGIKTALKSLAASLTPAATLTRRTNRTLAASVTAAATLTKRTARTLAASIDLSATVVKRTSRALAASLAPAAAVLKHTRRALAASITATATVLGVLGGAVLIRGLVRSVLTWTAAVRADLTHTPAVRADLTNTPAASADLTVTPAVRVDITHDTDD